MEFTFLADAEGNEISLTSEEATTSAVTATRRTTTAARLKAIFGDVDNVDAFTGMVSEPHVEGTEFGELQLAMWTTQFEALRDGDRLFYGNYTLREAINAEYGIDFRRSLAEVIVDNTDIDRADLPESVFVLDPENSGASVAAQPEGEDLPEDSAQPEDSDNRGDADRPQRRNGERRNGGRRDRG